MSIQYAWYGADGDGNIRLACRATSNGDVTLSLSDGRSLTQTCDTSTNDGHVLFTFAAAGDLSGVLSHGGSTYEHTMQIRPLKASGMRVIVYSCAADVNAAQHVYDVMRNQTPDLVVHLGDFVYADATDGTYNGETVVSVRKVNIPSTGVSAYRPHYRAVKRGNGWKRLAASCPMWGMWDDHEIFDGYNPGSINNINKYADALGSYFDALAVEQIPESDDNATKATKMQAIYDAARQAFYEHWAMTNPINTDTEIDADALYFRVRVGDTVEFIVPDLMTYKDMGSDRNGNHYTDLSGYTYFTSLQDDSREMFRTQDSVQMGWLMDSMAAAETACAHKLLLMSKQPYQHNADALNNGDAFARYTGQRDSIVQAFADMTSTVWMAADSHQGAVFKNDTYDFLSIEPCSISSGIHQQGAGYNSNVSWKIWGNDGQPDAGDSQWVFGIVDITPEAQTHTMVDAHTARSVWGPYRIAAGEKATVERRTRIG